MIGAPEPVTFPSTEVPGLDTDPLIYRLRTEEGMPRVVLPYGKPAWLALRQEDVKAVLTDKRFSRALAVGPDEPRILPIIQRANLLVCTDGPEHVRLRQFLAATFTVRGVERFRPSTQRIVDDLLDEMEWNGRPVDLMEAFALAVPALVVCDLLGVPPTHRKRFCALADSFSVPKLAGMAAEEIMGIGRELRDYLAKLVRLRRKEPGDDLLSTIGCDGQVSDDELVGIAVTVLIAGHEATADQIANFTYLLLTRKEEARELREHPELLPSAIEELLRYVPLGVGTGLPRVATEDTQIGGVLVRAGEYVMPMMTAANRDGTVFDKPDRLDFRRQDSVPTTAHMTFGYGAHRCLGSALARLELQTAIGSLLRRFPSLALACSASEVEWTRGGLVRAPRALWVTW